MTVYMAPANNPAAIDLAEKLSNCNGPGFLLSKEQYKFIVSGEVSPIQEQPKSINRQEAEKVVRSVIANHAGDKLSDNLFKDSVDALMEEINGKEVN